MEHQLPVFIEVARGTGKKTTALELHQRLLGAKPFVEIDGSLLNEDNHDSVHLVRLENSLTLSINHQAKPEGNWHKQRVGRCF